MKLSCLWFINAHEQVYDSDNTGVVSLRTFQSTLQDVHVQLSQPELQLIVSQFGRPEDDKIYYDSFCRSLDGVPAQDLSTSFAQDPANTIGLSASSGPAPYLSTRVLQRVRELRKEGRDPRDIFEAQDLDNTGMVSIQRFREVVTKLQLLSTELQLSRAIEDCLCISNRSCVVFEDFCSMLERALNDRDPRGSGSGRDGGSVDGSGFDGLATRQSMLGASRGVMSSRGGNILFADDDHYARSSLRGNAYPIELEEGSDYLPSNHRGYSSSSSRALSPPKLTDSVNNSLRRYNNMSSSTPSRYLNYSGYSESNAKFSPRR